MAGLKFHLLGPPYVMWNDSILDIQRRQVRGLIYHLATYPNAIPQERLHYMFWEDKSEAVCRRNLSQLLTHARSALPDSKILIVKNSLVMLDYENIWCDIIEFRKSIQTSKEADHHKNFQKAVELYRGPYLDGVQLPGGREFEYIVEHERFNLERNYLNLLYKLILLEKRQKDFESAIEYAYQYLAIDNLCEDVHRQIIILYGLAGKQERAVEQYKICENLLEQELQTKPSKKTQAVLQEVLSERPLEKGEVSKGVSSGIRPVRNNPAFISKDYLAQLDSLVTGGKHGPWGIVLLRGELGIGKSSLLSKYLEGFEKKALILFTKCNPGSSSIQYWPLRQICLAAGKSNHIALKKNPDILSAIEKCLQRLAITSESVNTNVSNMLTKELYFSLLVDTIYQLADVAEGLILCIEDLEWADEDTLDFILYLCPHLFDKRVLVLASYCCEENEYLRKFFHNVQLVDDFLGIMTLHGVGLDSTLSLLKYWLGDFEGAQTVAEKLHQLTAGNPLFLTEILRWVVQSNRSIYDVLDNQPVSWPLSISTVVNFRLSLLEQTERRVLDAIAVKGYLNEVDQFVDQTGLSVQQILDALDELVSHHFLVNHSIFYQFKHEIIRQSVLELMSPMRKRFLEQANTVNP